MWLLLLISLQNLIHHFTTFQAFLGTKNLQCEYTYHSIDRTDGAYITLSLTTPHARMPLMENPSS